MITHGWMHGQPENRMPLMANHHRVVAKA